jgi:hypothetical protein
MDKRKRRQVEHVAATEETEGLALFGTCFGVNLRLTESRPKDHDGPKIGKDRGSKGVGVKRPAISVLCSI